MKGKARGFTVPELTVALAIAAMIGLAIVGVSMALSSAYAHSQGFYQCLHTSRGALTQVQCMLRGARLVTGASRSSITLWMEDSDGNGKINPSELCSLQYDPQTRQIVRYWCEFPDTLDSTSLSALNAEMSLDSLVNQTDLATSTQSPYVQSAVVAGGVKDFRISVYPEPPLSRLVTVEVTVNEESRSITLRSAVSLRADAVDCVGVSDGQYVLTREAWCQAGTSPGGQ